MRFADGRQRSRHHGLPRSRPCAGGRHGDERMHGGTLRQGDRLLEGQGRLDALLRAGQELLGRPRHRRRPDPARPRPRFRPKYKGLKGCCDVLPRRRRRQPGRLSRIAQPRRALGPPGHLHHRKQRLLDGHQPEALERLQHLPRRARRRLRHHLGHGRNGADIYEVREDRRHRRSSAPTPRAARPSSKSPPTATTATRSPTPSTRPAIAPRRRSSSTRRTSIRSSSSERGSIEEGVLTDERDRRRSRRQRAPKRKPP